MYACSCVHISVSVGMCSHMSVCAHVHVCVCTLLCVHVCVHTFVCVHVSLHACMHVHVCTYLCECGACVHTCQRVHMCTFVCAYLWECVHVFTCICACMCACLCVQICACKSMCNCVRMFTRVSVHACLCAHLCARVCACMFVMRSAAPEAEGWGSPWPCWSEVGRGGGCPGATASLCTHTRWESRGAAAGRSRRARTACGSSSCTCRSRGPWCCARTRTAGCPRARSTRWRAGCTGTWGDGGGRQR